MSLVSNGVITISIAVWSLEISLLQQSVNLFLKRREYSFLYDLRAFVLDHPEKKTHPCFDARSRVRAGGIECVYTRVGDIPVMLSEVCQNSQELCLRVRR